MESPRPATEVMLHASRQEIACPHPLNDVLLEEGFWDDPFYPHSVGKDEWEENFFDQLNQHMALLATKKSNIANESDLNKVCLSFVANWRQQEPEGGRFLRRNRVTGLWNDVGDKEAACFICNRLADAYDIQIQFNEAEPRTRAERIKLVFGEERKTKITNESSRDIYVIIADEKVSCTRSFTTRGQVPYVHITAESGGEHTREAPPCQQAIIRSGEHQYFDLDQKEYYLTVYSKDDKNAFVIHMKNRRVLARQNWAFKKADLKKTVGSP